MHEFLLSHMGPRLSRRPPSALRSTVIQQKIPEFLGETGAVLEAAFSKSGKLALIPLHYCSPQIVVAD